MTEKGKEKTENEKKTTKTKTNRRIIKLRIKQDVKR